LQIFFGAEKENFEQKGVPAILRLSLGAGLSPAEGGVEPTAGSTFNQWIGRPRYSRITLTIPIFAQ
jgi:hypothetical protein